jgi:hypothetical protein
MVHELITREQYFKIGVLFEDCSMSEIFPSYFLHRFEFLMLLLFVPMPVNWIILNGVFFVD